MTKSTTITTHFTETEGVEVTVSVDDAATIVRVFPLPGRRHWSIPSAREIRELIHQAHAEHHLDTGVLYSKRGTISPSYWKSDGRQGMGWSVEVTRVCLRQPL